MREPRAMSAERWEAGWASPSRFQKNICPGRKSMTTLEQYVDFIDQRGPMITLGEILDTKHAAEYRKQHTLLRKIGWKVTVLLNKKAPGLNLYTFKRPGTS